MKPGASGKKIYLIFFLSAFIDAQIINIESKRFVKDTNGFAGRADFFASANRNRALLISLGANVHTQFKHNRHRILNVVDYAYTKAGENPFVNNGYLHLRYNYKIKKGVYWECYGQGQFNLAILLDKRWLAGTGIRLHIIKKEGLGIFYGLAYMYEYQSFNQNISEYRFHRASTYISCFYRSKWMEITATAYYQPVLTQFNLYRLSGDAQLEFLPGRKINFVATFSGFYDELLPQGIPKFIYVSRSTLRFWLR